MGPTMWKYVLAWILMVLIAIANGVLRLFAGRVWMVVLVWVTLAPYLFYRWQ